MSSGGGGLDAGALVCRGDGLTVLQSLRLFLKICWFLLRDVDQRAGDDDAYGGGRGLSGDFHTGTLDVKGSEVVT